MAVGPKTLVILLLAFNILKFTSGLGFCFWCKSQLVLRWTNIIVILQIFVCIRGNPTAKIRAFQGKQDCMYYCPGSGICVLGEWLYSRTRYVTRIKTKCMVCKYDFRFWVSRECLSRISTFGCHFLTFMYIKKDKLIFENQLFVQFYKKKKIAILLNFLLARHIYHDT